jgi:hypothetical protein
MPVPRTPEGDPTPQDPQSRLAALLGEDGTGLDPEPSPAEQKRQRREKRRAEARVEGDDLDPEEFDDDIGAEDEDDLEPEEDFDDEDADFDDEDDFDDDLDDDDGDDLHTVKVDGEDLQVPYEELVKGYSRQAHFTRQMQELREREKEFEPHREAVLAERQQYAVLLNQLNSYLQQTTQTRTPEQWAELKATDPVGYTMAREEERENQGKIQAAERELLILQAKEQQEQQEALRRQVAEGQEKLVETLPEWKDPKVRRKDLRAIAEYAKGYGYTEEDLGMIYDHRLMLILNDARKYAELRARKGSLKPDKRSRTASPGRSPKPQPRRKARKAYKDARENLRKSGSDADAVAAISHLL